MPIRDRLKDLNTKAYYLLVALSFLYARQNTTPTTSLKIAISLTALVAALPVQDYVRDTWTGLLKGIRFGKVICLTAAVACTLRWVWTH